MESSSRGCQQAHRSANFIRTRHFAYQTAVQRVADMKRDLVRAQVANPDLQTALEVLIDGSCVKYARGEYHPFALPL